MVDSWNIQKVIEPFFSRKIHFCQNLSKKGWKWPYNRVLWILWKKKCSLVFPGNNLNWKIILDWYFSTNPITCKILVLQLWAQMLPVSQIAGLSVCSYHFTYAFQREFTLYSCLNVKELLAWSMQVCPNGLVFVCELSGCGFKPSYSHLNCRIL